ncbi:DUF4352 domain-containing protein [Rhodococcus sp. Rp3]|uniref:DUF4352 domain-containing protein n=1 Tax=Rhodococcus sp. Rp3 TaxID=2807635 RepID=UPI00233F5F64|nr:DUF4352 domain-containing protein [Rhodococcus sp. Rp3]MDC3729323.1 DUF4352 domain-containing protein [Rhodococcus sp. Rp3]MDC3729338.1 DUF4352 domain-containing protein [Rhodococcus sp. Rp3]
MLPPAGWYPDPQNPQLHRWWDGQKWTSPTRPAQGPTANAALKTEAVRAQSSKGGRWKLPAAIASVLAIGVIIAASVSGGSDETRSTSSQRTSTTHTPPSTARYSTITTAVPTPPAPAPDAAAASPKPAAPPTPAGLGKPFRDGKFEFVVHSWDGQSAAITIRNIGDRPQTVSISSLYLIDTNDRKFEPEFDWASDLAFANLNPGQSVSGTLTYILSGAIPSHLELHDSMFSGGVDVPLR